jgi:hypothetical protein
MEQRDLQRFYRTSKRELNNSEEKNCKKGAIDYMGTELQNHGQKRKMKRKGQIIEDQQFECKKRGKVQGSNMKEQVENW